MPVTPHLTFCDLVVLVPYFILSLSVAFSLAIQFARNFFDNYGTQLLSLAT